MGRFVPSQTVITSQTSVALPTTDGSSSLSSATSAVRNATQNVLHPPKSTHLNSSANQARDAQPLKDKMPNRNSTIRLRLIASIGKGSVNVSVSARQLLSAHSTW